MTRRHVVKKNHQTKNHQTHSNQRSPRPPDCLRRYTHSAATSVPENCGGSFPMKGIQHIHTTSSNVCICSEKGTASSKIQKKTMTAALVMVCAPVAGLRVPSCCRCPSQPQCLRPLGHRSLKRALVSAPFQSVPFLPRPKNRNAPRRFSVLV